MPFGTVVMFLPISVRFSKFSMDHKYKSNWISLQFSQFLLIESFLCRHLSTEHFLFYRSKCSICVLVFALWCISLSEMLSYILDAPPMHKWKTKQFLGSVSQTNAKHTFAPKKKTLKLWAKNGNQRRRKKLQIWFSRLDMYDDGWWLHSLLWLFLSLYLMFPCVYCFWLLLFFNFSYWLFTLFHTKITTNDIIRSTDTICSIMMINIIDIRHMCSTLISMTWATRWVFLCYY